MLLWAAWLGAGLRLLAAAAAAEEPPRYKTAEMADAMLGGAAAPPLLSLLPAGTCDADAPCEARDSPPPPPEPEPEPEPEPIVVLETVLPPCAAAAANGTDGGRAPKVACEERSGPGPRASALHVLNVSQDLMEFLNPNSSDCTMVLFYTPWCRFSANLAPHFNSLPRAFPTLRFVALDASQHSSLSTRFGTVAVPNILLFQGAKPMARFNHTDRTLETLKAFIFNQTGIEAKPDVVVTEEDREGPLPSILTKGVDWLLLFSLLFLASFIMYATIRTESIRWLIPGQEQEHQD
ncbi:PREDICTED: thioredoxin domain-containing protein 15 [Crocodylus porosus]|uniref:Thioredoxin domain containing 15 n=3 Tax=Crocodylia TaxID=1294634 RepID=A0A7M4EUZ6_CROPO|nr:PREDICTED: thioredoxin domain-containing protein 15 [Crocodylus porosus]